MTHGPIMKQIFLFTVPLLIGNLFQQLYNTVDSIVIGNFAGKEALAAVGSVGAIINSLIGFFTGLATGAGVVISQYYGAKNDQKVSQATHTMVAMTLILCVILSFVGVLITPALLKAMSTPEDVIDKSAVYLRIYFSGLSGLLLYNMGAGILRAIGDSRRPLYFLIFSTCTNIVLDILFVAVLHMEVAGVAIATIIAQFLSALLMLLTLVRINSPCRISVSKLKIDPEIMKQIIQIGFPAAIQSMITSISNVFVQAYINVFGSSVMAGWSVCQKIDSFMLLPMISIALTVTTFVGQNIGARKPARAQEGTRVAFCFSAAVTVFLMIPLLVFTPQLIRFFNSDAEVMQYGILFIRLLSPFYVICCINQIYASALRGAGNSQAPMLIMLGSFVVFRQIYLFIVSRVSGALIPTALGYPVGWLLCSVLILLYYRRFQWNTKTIH